MRVNSGVESRGYVEGIILIHRIDGDQNGGSIQGYSIVRLMRFSMNDQRRKLYHSPNISLREY